ncbi:DUF1122 domain-containing protein [candidate division WOR-3 bacterium]|uniref:DUF1122 domain-containing protein n=1 Tax=candidate division WOR-3 bacterium TaxID=2052148 RepID=A0A9D5K9F1_UNCW3|nr:DUF1122 domain-containing protein [candidate division WOR-3 bacterium]MBD3364763.1 DUF1122 domain-containing protein [candidate division WOR-3 bacterium]
MHDKIDIKDGEIGNFKGKPARIADKGLKQSNEVVNKQVMLGETRLMDVTVESGRPNAFNYIELHNIKPVFTIDGEKVEYFDSDLEDTVLAFFSGLLGRADIIHVSYDKDKETWNQLQSSVPAVLSRLGFKLFGLGFTWFKDWYIAEGWREGPVKLTAEKPIDARMVLRNVEGLREEVESYLEKDDIEDKHNRAESILGRLKRLQADPTLALV